MSDDPLQVRSHKAKSANASDLMKAKAVSRAGRVTNFCPYGCENHELDEFEYCRHLIGFTPPGRKDVYEYMPPPEPGDKKKRRTVDGNDVRPVQRGDKLVRITTSYRVYRDVDLERERAELAEAKARQKQTQAGTGSGSAS